MSRACQEQYSNVSCEIGFGLALYNALRALGLPCRLPFDQSGVVNPPNEVAVLLDQAFRRRLVNRVYLCPLDMADDFPDVAFGSASVSSFSKSEIGDLIDLPRLQRYFGSRSVDTSMLSEFRWLTVRKVEQVEVAPGARAIPILYETIGRDLGAINPHEGRFHSVVEDAVFFLMLAPWEDWSNYPEVDWRGFRIPWVYSVSDDIFESCALPPQARSLSWETNEYIDAAGEWVQYDRPVRLELKDSALSVENILNEDRWIMVEKALRSPLFDTPIVHFMVRAFLATGVDEYLAHITAIEAALGTKNDYAGSRKPIKPSSPSKRMACRINGLLGDRRKGECYLELFDLRSQYLHGRKMTSISTAMRANARRLAREIVAALVQKASLASQDILREDYLSEILAEGKTMH